MYENYFCTPVKKKKKKKKKTIHAIFTKINRVRPTVKCNVHTKFELKRIHRLDAIVFTHKHAHIHTYMHTYITP